MHEFQVETVESDGAVIHRMSGVLGDAHQPHEFHQTFLAGLAEAPARIVLNLQGVENLYSAGIGIIANCFTEAKAVGKSVILCCVPANIEKLLTLTGVMPLLTAVENEAEALSVSID
ncbi:MAG: STAS domain-containing protein [Planctomycetota bacterium]|nr:STAS domain-containing protein [Planctomycetota bacterium]